jgi:hypothetical protein
LSAADATDAKQVSAARHPEASAAVRKALQHEISGSETARRELLEAAVAHSPEFAPARWHLGYVKDARRGWLKHDEFLATSKAAHRLATYERERVIAPDTVAGNLELADWCAAEKLTEQERAHLMRVIDLNPDHAAARRRLGFVRQGDDWVSRQEIARERQRQSERRQSLAQWRPVLQELRAGLESRSQRRQEYAASKLREIHDADAIAAIEEVFHGAQDEIAFPAIYALAGIDDPEAAAALTRIAVQWPSATLREAAAKRLADREHDTFVPQLVGSMQSPVTSRFVALQLPRGRIGYRHEFVRETKDAQQVLQLDTEYRGAPGGSRRATAREATEDIAQTATRREQVAAEENQRTAALNERLASVLKIATGADLPAKPEAWWNWWNEQNEVFVMGAKPKTIVQRAQRVEIADRAAGASALGGGSESDDGDPPTDCLAAGTPVWTAKGPLAIEQICVGDLVLSQDCETGELAYKPVLKTTIRPAGKLIKIEAEGETFETSGGHLFWVAGKGWIRSRKLQSGQVLHTAAGPAHVSAVGEGREAETYNLVVADFSTYFVGNAKVLSHDNTVRTPTRALVPGLRVD